jgi:hypothetical protein
MPAEHDYLHLVCTEFHARISWHLTDDEEPDLPLPEYDPFATPEIEELDEEEMTMKRQRIETMNAANRGGCDLCVQQCVTNISFLLLI